MNGLAGSNINKLSTPLNDFYTALQQQRNSFRVPPALHTKIAKKILLSPGIHKIKLRMTKNTDENMMVPGSNKKDTL